MYNSTTDCIPSTNQNSFITMKVCPQTFNFFSEDLILRARAERGLPTPHPLACAVMSRGLHFRSHARRSFEEIESLWTDYNITMTNFDTFPTMRNYFRGIPRKIYNFRRKLFEPVANCSKQTGNQNTNIAAEVKSCAEKNIRFD